MKENLQLMEELQSAYSAEYRVNIWVTGVDGKLITESKGNNRLYDMFSRREQDWMKVILNKNPKKELGMNTPVFLDLFPGVYTLMSSIRMDEGEICRLWAGMIVEGPSLHHVEKQLEVAYPEEDVHAIMEEIPVINATNKDSWMNWMKSFRAIASCLFQGSQNSFEDVQLEVFQRAVQGKRLDAKQLLTDFLAEYQAFDFIGIAEQSEEKARITEVIGAGTESVIGAEFYPGEGFLGRVLLTEEAEAWEGIGTDPRNAFFQQYGFSPTSLFCHPLRLGDKTNYLLFGGSRDLSTFSERQLKLAKTLAVTMESHTQLHELVTTNDAQLRRLSMLSEISKLMANAADMKRIIYMLVDIGLNLGGGTFASLLLKDQVSGKVKFISRGKLQTDAETYAKKVAERYFTGTDETKHYKPEIYSTEQGESILECVLQNRGKVQGVLCIGMSVKSEGEIQEQLPFLETLAVVGGISLQLTDNNDSEAGDRQVFGLSRAVEQFDKEAYTRSMEAAELATTVAMKLGLHSPLIRDIIHACQLSYYSPTFIEEMLPDRQVHELMQEGEHLVDNQADGWDEASVGGQLYALVMLYTSQHNLEAIPETLRDEEIVRAFSRLIDEQMVIEQEFPVPDELAEDQKLHAVSSTIKEMNLSPREQEVLDLVIQGMNNKEIAKELYISGHTVKNHVTKIFQKLDVPDRAHAISKVYQLKYQSG